MIVMGGQRSSRSEEDESADPRARVWVGPSGIPRAGSGLMGEALPMANRLVRWAAPAGAEWPSVVGHRRYLNGPGRPPISGFGFALPRGRGAAPRRAGPHVRSPRAGVVLGRGEGRRAPCTASGAVGFVHAGPAPVLAKAAPLAIRGAAGLDGRRLRG